MANGLSIRTVSRRLAGVLLALAVGCFTLEIASRVVHLWRAPLLPYGNNHGAPFLPARADLRVSFYGARPNRYTTDAWSARIADRSLANSRMQDGVFVVGDSQALGYMLDFGETFASRVAAKVLGDARRTRLLAAPTADPDTFPAMLTSYGARAEHQKLFIVVVNLGNDLDESFFEGINPTEFHTGGAHRFLLFHSFLFMDMVLLRANWSRRSDEPIDNPIVYLLSPDERTVLARAVVDQVDSVFRRYAPTADRQLVVVVPSDYQVDPREFEKYRRYYRTSSDFERWKAEMPVFAGMMNAVEEYLSTKLEDLGYQVVRFSQLVPEHGHERLFQPSSPHLTAYSNQLLAQAIAGTIGRAW